MEKKVACTAILLVTLLISCDFGVSKSLKRSQRQLLYSGNRRNVIDRVLRISKRQSSDEPQAAPSQEYFSDTSNPFGSSQSFGYASSLTSNDNAYSSSSSSSSSNGDSSDASSYLFPDKIPYASLRDPSLPKPTKASSSSSQSSRRYGSGRYGSYGTSGVPVYSGSSSSSSRSAYGQGYPRLNGGSSQSGGMSSLNGGYASLYNGGGGTTGRQSFYSSYQPSYPSYNSGGYPQQGMMSRQQSHGSYQNGQTPTYGTSYPSARSYPYQQSSYGGYYYGQKPTMGTQSYYQGYSPSYANQMFQTGGREQPRARSEVTYSGSDIRVGSSSTRYDTSAQPSSIGGVRAKNGIYTGHMGTSSFPYSSSSSYGNYGQGRTYNPVASSSSSNTYGGSYPYSQYRQGSSSSNYDRATLGSYGSSRNPYSSSSSNNDYSPYRSSYDSSSRATTGLQYMGTNGRMTSSSYYAGSQMPQGRASMTSQYGGSSNLSPGSSYESSSRTSSGSPYGGSSRTSYQGSSSMSAGLPYGSSSVSQFAGSQSSSSSSPYGGSSNAFSGLPYRSSSSTSYGTQRGSSVGLSYSSSSSLPSASSDETSSSTLSRFPYGSSSSAQPRLSHGGSLGAVQTSYGESSNFPSSSSQGGVSSASSEQPYVGVSRVFAGSPYGASSSVVSNEEYGEGASSIPPGPSQATSSRISSESNVYGDYDGVSISRSQGVQQLPSESEEQGQDEPTTEEAASSFGNSYSSSSLGISRNSDISSSYPSLVQSRVYGEHTYSNYGGESASDSQNYGVSSEASVSSNEESTNGENSDSNEYNAQDLSRYTGADGTRYLVRGSPYDSFTNSDSDDSDQDEQHIARAGASQQQSQTVASSNIGQTNGMPHAGSSFSHLTVGDSLRGQSEGTTTEESGTLSNVQTNSRFYNSYRGQSSFGSSSSDSGHPSSSQSNSNSHYGLPSRSRGRHSRPETSNSQVSYTNSQAGGASEGNTEVSLGSNFEQANAAYGAGYEDPYADESDEDGSDDFTNVENSDNSEEETRTLSQVQTGRPNQPSVVSSLASHSDARSRSHGNSQSRTFLVQRANLSALHTSNTNNREREEATTTGLPDIHIDKRKLITHFFLDRKPISSLLCARSANCLSSSAYGSSSSVQRKLLRFQTTVHNIGTAPFLPQLEKSDWLWHECHNHSHSMAVFTHYDLLDRNRRKVAEGHKASFCLEDSTCRRRIRKVYNCDKGHQGISVGCEDTYKASIDCQWIDVTGIHQDDYIFRVLVNPDKLVRESNYENNGIECNVSIKRYTADIWNCKVIGI